MKQYSILLIGIALILAVTADQNTWLTFIRQHGKKYRNPAEEMARMRNFMENFRKITEHNERFRIGVVPYEMGLNEFSDMSSDEFHSMMNGHQAQNNNSSNIKGRPHVVAGDADIPKSIDWRTKGAVTSVDKQGGCTVCWAFSSCGALEAAYFRKTGKLEKLSAQNLVDCVDKDKKDCYFGNFYFSYEYIKKNGGIDTDKSYSYEEKKDKCRYDEKNKAGATVQGVATIPEGDEKALTHAIATVGPIIVSMNSKLIQHYKSGVFHDPKCSKDLNHGVLAVGYGTDDKDGDYYIMKNSYGKSWGMDGYMKIARNKDNLCGIGHNAGYPIV